MRNAHCTVATLLATFDRHELSNSSIQAPMVNILILIKEAFINISVSNFIFQTAAREKKFQVEKLQ
jgi:hypothetical protein